MFIRIDRTGALHLHRDGFVPQLSECPHKSDFAGRVPCTTKCPLLFMTLNPGEKGTDTVEFKCGWNGYIIGTVVDIDPELKSEIVPEKKD